MWDLQHRQATRETSAHSDPRSKAAFRSHQFSHEISHAIRGTARGRPIHEPGQLSSMPTCHLSDRNRANDARASS